MFLIPYLLVPVRTVIEVVSIVNKNLFACLNVMGGRHTGDDTKAWVIEGAELSIGHERVVGLVGKAGAVVGLIPENNHFPFLY